MPIKGARFRFKQLTPRKRVRLAFVKNRVVEVTSYTKVNGEWVRSHTRRMPRR